MPHHKGVEVKEVGGALFVKRDLRPLTAAAALVVSRLPSERVP